MFDVILLQVVHQVSPIPLQGKEQSLPGEREQPWCWTGPRRALSPERGKQTKQEVGLVRRSKAGRKNDNQQRWGVYAEKNEGP